MGQSLVEIAETLRTAEKKVQLIYAFNGTGKTRLSRAFKELISPKEDVADEEEAAQLKVLYYNAYTEDLFFWDNDLEGDTERKLSIFPNNFTSLVLDFLKDQGQDGNIVTNFQRYAGSDDITPLLNPDFSEVTFSLTRGNDENLNNVKVSKGEESNFIWSVFYSLLELVVETLNTAEPDERGVRQFDDLEYVFIDDPVSSLDDTHLIELAVNIAQLVKSSESEKLKFVITTHNPLFFNVLFNEFNNADQESGYRRRHSLRRRLERAEDGTFTLSDQANDAPFSYHLFLFAELEKAIAADELKKYHFNFLRNILEKTSSFLGYTKWKDLLPEDAPGSQTAYFNRIINLSSHSKISSEEVSAITENDKRVLARLVRLMRETYKFNTSVATE